MPDDKHEQQTNQIGRWLSCPECGCDDVYWSYNNGRLALSCENDDCLEATSRLIGRSTFRRRI